MARLAILIDGEYLQRVARDNFAASVDYGVLPNRIRDIVASDASEPLELLRTYFYDALPYMSNNPTADASKRRAEKEPTSGISSVSSFLIEQVDMRQQIKQDFMNQVQRRRQ